MSDYVDEKEIGLFEVGNKPCSPTTSESARSSHFVRRRRIRLKPPTEIRSCVVPIRFTETERSLLREQSQKIHLSVSDYVRKLALKRKMAGSSVPETNYRTYQELARIGNNLNQMVKRIHQGQVKVVNLPLLYELQRAVKAIGLKVLGADKA